MIATPTISGSVRSIVITAYSEAAPEPVIAVEGKINLIAIRRKRLRKLLACGQSSMTRTWDRLPAMTWYL
jgi:hypothetical protein